MELSSSRQQEQETKLKERIAQLEREQQEQQQELQKQQRRIERLEKFAHFDDVTETLEIGSMESPSSQQLEETVEIGSHQQRQQQQQKFEQQFGKTLEKLCGEAYTYWCIKLFPHLRQILGWFEKIGELYWEVDGDSFSDLRVFVIGIMNNRSLVGEVILRKKTLFIKYLCDHLRRLFANRTSRVTKEHQVKMFMEMLGFRDEEVIREIGELLKDVNFVFDFIGELRVAARREAFCHFFQHFVTNVHRLELDIDAWNDKEIRRLFQPIHASTVKIERMEIGMKAEQLEHMIEHVITTLPHLTKELVLQLWESSGRRFGAKLEEEISNFDTNTLQTEELAVKVRYNDIILHVVIRRGHSPLFIKSMGSYTSRQSPLEQHQRQFENLSVGEFEHLVVRKLFPRLRNENHLFYVTEDSCANIRRFVIGIVNEMNHLKLDGVENFRKKTFFIKFLCYHLRELFVRIRSPVASEHQMQLVIEMLEFREEEVIREIGELLKDFNFLFVFDHCSTSEFRTSPLPDATHREGLCHFIQHFVTNVERLSLDIDAWNDNEIRRLFQSIQTSTLKIEKMEITMKPQLEHVSDVVAILPHLTSTLKLWLEGNDDDERKFYRKLKEEISNFDTETLQIHRLEVKNKYGRSFHVVLRRGQPPQFIKCE